jgi:diketogulonate reductase-like aldo/keto reductase
VLEEVARAYGATPRQVALKFLTRRAPLFAIPKASHPAHARDNAAADGLPLTKGDLARLDAAFPLGPVKRELPVV